MKVLFGISLSRRRDSQKKMNKHRSSSSLFFFSDNFLRNCGEHLRRRCALLFWPQPWAGHMPAIASLGHRRWAGCASFRPAARERAPLTTHSFDGQLRLTTSVAPRQVLTLRFPSASLSLQELGDFPLQLEHAVGQLHGQGDDELHFGSALPGDY